MITVVLVAAMLAAVLAGLGAVLWVINHQMASLKAGLKNDAALGMIKQDLQGINNTLNVRLDKSSATMQDAMSRQFAASSRLIGEVTRDLTELKESNKQVMSITDELKLLQNTLQNKTRIEETIK